MAYPAKKDRSRGPAAFAAGQGGRQSGSLGAGASLVSAPAHGAPTLCGLAAVGRVETDHHRRADRFPGRRFLPGGGGDQAAAAADGRPGPGRYLATVHGSPGAGGGELAGPDGAGSGWSHRVPGPGGAPGAAGRADRAAAHQPGAEPLAARRAGGKADRGQHPRIPGPRI